MLKQFQKIVGIGRFENYPTPEGKTTLERFNLIFSPNGCGKTTLAAILRSLKAQNCDYILGRKTLGCSSDPEATIRLETGNAEFMNSTWNMQCPNIEIFDMTFVDDNVYSGNIVELGQRRSLYHFVVGEEGVKLAHEEEELDVQIREKNKEITSKKKQIENVIIDDIDLDRFISLRATKNIDKQIVNKEKKLEALLKSNEINEKPLLKKIDLSDLPINDILKLLSKTIENISEDAERKTKEHIESFNIEHGERWISYGLRYIINHCCPFCGQSIEGVQLIRAYQDYFNKGYTDLKEEIKEFNSQVEGLKTSDNITRLTKVLLSNKALSEFWNQYIQAEYPNISLEDIEEVWKNVIGLFETNIKKKYSNPLESIKSGKELSEAISSYRAMQSEISKYNAKVEKLNALISTRKKELCAGDKEITEKELTILKNTKKRYEMEVNTLCNEYQTLKRKKKILDLHKKKAQDKLRKFSQDIFKKYQNGINEYLSKFAAGFSISKTKTSFAGGQPSSSYCISINDKEVNLGNAKTPIGKPSFGNTLSSGDRSALALAFFLARIDLDTNKAEKIIVFDDPICSFDANRRIYTKQRICEFIREDIKQIIVLSHYAPFLKMLWDETKKPEFKTKKNALSIEWYKNTSNITYWDIEKETREGYLKHHYVLLDYLKNGVKTDEMRRSVANSVRLLLECNLRFRFPQEFESCKMLGQFLSLINDCPKSDPLSVLKPNHTDLKEINDYSLRYHHHNADSEPIDNSELQTYVRRVIVFVQGIKKICM